MGKINLQMYSFMDGEHNDTRENLKLASQMGYDGVELFGPNLELPLEELKGLLEEYHLCIDTAEMETVFCKSGKWEWHSDLYMVTNEYGITVIYSKKRGC